MPSTPRLLCAPLVLVALLLMLGTAHAATPAPGIVQLASEEELSLEEELELEEEAGLEEDELESELEADECEIAEEELWDGEIDEDELREECEEGEERAASSGSVALEDCVLRSSHAHATTPAKGNKLKLTVGYTAYEPVSATVEVKAGAVRIATTHRRLGRSGVLRIVKSLGSKREVRHLAVRIRVSGSPGYCGRLETQRIKVR